jgi:hypothetical protein
MENNAQKKVVRCRLNSSKCRCPSFKSAHDLRSPSIVQQEENERPSTSRGKAKSEEVSTSDDDGVPIQIPPIVGKTLLLQQKNNLDSTEACCSGNNEKETTTTGNNDPTATVEAQNQHQQNHVNHHHHHQRRLSPAPERKMSLSTSKLQQQT